MAESVTLIATLLAIAVPVLGACWVWQDAHRLKKSGAYITPWLWAALVLFLWLVNLPIYLYLRRTVWQTSMSLPSTTGMAAQDAGKHRLRVEFRVFYWVASVVFAVMLSMYATWVTISRYPIPDSDAINLGLFFFFVLVFVDLLIIGDLLLFVREGKHMEKGLLAYIFGGGFLIAAVVGWLTWGIGWLIADKPWVSRVFRIAMLSLAIMQPVWFWWLRRKSTASSKPGTTGMSGQ